VPYEPWVRILRALLPLILLVPSVSSAQRKREQPVNGPTGKTTGACGARILPLVEGNQWTYEFVASGVALRDDLKKLDPVQPREVVITVKSVETKGTDTVVTLEEKTTANLATKASGSVDPNKEILDVRTLTTTITCGAKKFEISPDSFFFAGEPGGMFELAFDKVDRPRDTSWKLVNGTIGDAEWREDIVAHFTRTSTPGSDAKLDGGKLELERKFVPAQPERLNTKVGLYTAERLVLTTTGRITFDHPSMPDAKPWPLPDNWVNQLWLVPGVGVVQALNAYSQEYILKSVQLK
jgi:hypothetical protein